MPPPPQKIEAFTLDITSVSQLERLNNTTIDTIICINVLEHIEDDFQALLNMKNILSPGGKIILFVPALSKLYSYLDKNAGHYRRYDKGQIADLSRKACLKIIDDFYFNFWGIPVFFIKGKYGKEKQSDETFTSIIGENSSKLINFASIILNPMEKLFRPVLGVSEIAILQKE